MFAVVRTSFNAYMTTINQDLITRTLAKRSFCTLATTSSAARPHVAGVVYAFVDGMLYVSTTRSSRKARNIAQNPNVFICVPVRRMPFGPPPSTVQFASTAFIVPTDHPEIRELANAGRLKNVTSHGELEMADGCFVRIETPATYLTYGLGMSLRDLARDPLNAAGRLPVRGPTVRTTPT